MGFEELYSTEMCMSSRQSLISEFACCFLTEEERDWIGRDVTVEEVKDGLWSLRPFKALGPDGLHAGFYQQFWGDVGNSVCKEVLDIFKYREVPEYLNKTLITLISKYQSPESLNNYKPISLCNSFYKVV